MQPFRSARAGRTRTLTLAVAAMALAWSSWPVSAGTGAGRLLGRWQHPENHGEIEVYSCQRNRLCVRIVRNTDAQKLDNHNPNPDLRSRPIVGMVIMSGAEPMADGRWFGRLYNRNDGHFYDGYLAPAPIDRLSFTGCLMIVLCRTVVWHRPPKKGA